MISFPSCSFSDNLSTGLKWAFCPFLAFQKAISVVPRRLVLSSVGFFQTEMKPNQRKHPNWQITTFIRSKHFISWLGLARLKIRLNISLTSFNLFFILCGFTFQKTMNWTFCSSSRTLIFHSIFRVKICEMCVPRKILKMSWQMRNFWRWIKQRLYTIVLQDFEAPEFFLFLS